MSCCQDGIPDIPNTGYGTCLQIPAVHQGCVQFMDAFRVYHSSFARIEIRAIFHPDYHLHGNINGPGTLFQHGRTGFQCLV